MKKFKQNVKNLILKLTFKQQLVLSMIGIAAGTMLLMGTLLYGISKNTLEDNYQETHAYNMELFSSNIKIQLNEIINASRELLENEKFTKVLLSDQGSGSYFSSAGQSELDKLFHGIEDGNSYIQGIMIVSAQGKFRYVQKHSANTGAVNNFYKTGDILEQDWVTVADEAMGKEVFYGYDILDTRETEQFSMIKRMNQPGTGVLLGYLVVNIDKGMITKVFGTKTDSFKSNNYLILDLDENRQETPGEAQVVYSNTEEGELDQILYAYQQEKSQGNYLFSSYQDASSGWEIVSVIDQGELRAQSNYIRWIMLLAFLVLIILIVPIATFLSRQITYPVQLLEETIYQVGEGNYSLENKFDNSEIGQVGQHFVDMASNNLKLRDQLLQSEIKEREAELLLLQSQINPHFLYNTLDALYFMAVIDEADDIAEMVKSLSDTFKLSLNKGDKLITVSNELKKIEAYMKIQNLRYHNRFQMNVDIDEGIMEEKILSFILQPVVENAVYHGLEKKIGNGLITLSGYQEGELLHFIVNDNGVGIEDISKLDKGYGVRNIRERIHLFYGEEYDVIFESAAGKGTTVFFTLPLIREGEDS